MGQTISYWFPTLSLPAFLNLLLFTVSFSWWIFQSSIVLHKLETYGHLCLIPGGPTSNLLAIANSSAYRQKFYNNAMCRANNHYGCGVDVRALIFPLINEKYSTATLSCCLPVRYGWIDSCFYLTNLPASDNNDTKISLNYLTNIYSVHPLESTVLEGVESYHYSLKLGEKSLLSEWKGHRTITQESWLIPESTTFLVVWL